MYWQSSAFRRKPPAERSKPARRSMVAPLLKQEIFHTVKRNSFCPFFKQCVQLFLNSFILKNKFKKFLHILVCQYCGLPKKGFQRSGTSAKSVSTLTEHTDWTTYSARIRILFMAPTQAIWSRAFSSSVIPSASCICNTTHASRAFSCSSRSTR